MAKSPTTVGSKNNKKNQLGKKRTAIGLSKFSRPKNKNRRRIHGHSYRGQGR